MDYSQAIDFLQTFPDAERGNQGGQAPFMPLESMKVLLNHLGSPQHGTRTIHITGSKGKGSTASFIASILKSSGYRTALFTSPHLHSYRERIAFDLQPISEAAFAQGVVEIAGLLEKEQSALSGLNLSTFGLLTALFFHLVNKASPKIDWQIVEVGLGGTNDATNVFQTKDIAVITPISLEHTAILGQTVSEIAKNKGGIITSGCTTVLAPQHDPSVQDVIKAICAERNSTLVAVDECYHCEVLANKNYDQQFAVMHDKRHNAYQIHMLGQHQVENATTAVAVAHCLQNPPKRNWEHADSSQNSREQDPSTKITESAIRDGLAQAQLPGRFEIFKPTDSRAATIILDCAHNQDSARALAHTITDIFPSHKCIFIIGVNQDKHLEEIHAELKGISREIIATASDNPRAMPASEIVSRLQHADSQLKITECKNISEALASADALAAASSAAASSHAKARLPARYLICITGSFYLVAEAREQLLAGN